MRDPREHPPFELAVKPAQRALRPDFGLLALVVASAGLVSGLFLAFHYAPTLEAAHPSLRHLESEVMLGGLLRGLHHWCGTGALLLAAAHGLRVLFHGGHLPPRRRLWVIGCGLGLVLLGFAYTGYLLPGDERAFTGMSVMESVAESTPLIGPGAAAILVGGDTISSATLTRIHAVHTMLLPALLILLVVAFVREWRRAGPLHHYADDSRDVVPIGPSDVRRMAVAATAVLLLMLLLGWLSPPLLGPQVDPTGGDAPDARPEWFFLWVNQLLRWLPGPTFLIAALLPGALALLAFALPWIQGRGGRSPASRKAGLVLVGALIVGWIALTAIAFAGQPPTIVVEEEGASAAQPDAAALEEQAAAVLKRFRCATCHAIDGAESDGSGPPLDRARFAEMYTRTYFRLKVGDPLTFWPETGMVYRPRRLKPTEEQLAVLERWFFGRAQSK